MSLESDEEIARRLQAEFDEEYLRGNKTRNNNRSNKHEISNSDSDKTMSEDELQNMRTKIKEKRDLKGKSKPKLNITVHEISDSDSDEINVVQVNQKTTVKQKNAVNSQASVHEISDSESDNEKPKTVKRSNQIKNQTKYPVDNRPLCQFGTECTRKNAYHKKMYRHDEDSQEMNAKRIKLAENSSNLSHFKSNSFGFYLTKVAGIPSEYNITGAIDIQDILSEKMGNLIESAQFNYLHDIEWIIQQYPTKFRSNPLLIVHGEQRESKKALTKEASVYPNVTLCQAKLDIMFGTHHSKMMILLYDNGLRIVIHTANLVRGDWYQKTQGVWLSPVFPKLSDKESVSDGESPTNFKMDFLEYLAAYNAPELNVWIARIKRHNLSSANVFLIGSTPGRHTGNKMSCFGHLKLRKTLKEYGPKSTVVTPDWTAIGQFSSIGSLGASADLWLNKELLVSLSATKSGNNKQLPKLELIFPSVENIRLSLEGYPAGGSVPYSNEVAKKQQWLHKLFHQWQSKVRGRSSASPHIKTYARLSPSSDSIGWFLVTSANMSKAAWGAVEKNGTQFMIRSYELGVLFIPQYLVKHKNGGDTIKLGKTNDSSDFCLPFDVPLTPYGASDQPWIWNISHKELPDRYGNMWCR